MSSVVVIMICFIAVMLGIGALTELGPSAVRNWKRRRERCPHGVRGGTWAQNCSACNQSRAMEAESHRKQLEEQERRRKLRGLLEELRTREAKRLSASLVPSLNELRSLSPQQFEDEVARMFERLGYTVEQTPYVNDQGRDAILHRGGEKYLVECKRYSERNTVGRPEIQQFYAAIMHDQAAKGFFVSSGNFSTGAVAFAAQKPIELVDGEQLLRYMLNSKQGDANDDTYRSVCLKCGAWVVHSLRHPRDELCQYGHVVTPTLTIEDVLAGANAPPKCARCGATMRLVTGRNGKFWGCSRYPECRSSRPFAAHRGAPR